MGIFWAHFATFGPHLKGCFWQDPRFRKGNEFTYWAPLEFEPGSGAVRTFRPFLDNVTLDLA